MKNLLMATLLLTATLGATAARADLFDGKRPLLCTAQRFFECDMATGCMPVAASEIGAPGGWTVDFRKKQFTGTNQNAEPNVIGSMQMLDGKLFLTGIQDGLPVQRDGVAWSASIANPDGTMTITVAGEGVALIGLGHCVPRE